MTIDHKNETCLKCKFYVTCRDPKKAFSYSCSKFKQASINEDVVNSFDTGIEFGTGYASEIEAAGVGSDYHTMELKLIEALDDSLGEGKKVPHDFRVDDRDIKEFPNFYKFVTSKNGLDSKPFAKQLAIGLHLFADYCPRCSHPNFSNIRKIPIKWNMDKLMEFVQPLNYGVCPKCKGTRWDFFTKEELNLYNEFVGCLGQRSGKSVTAGMLGAYQLHKYLKLQRPIEVYGLLKNSELMATFVGLTFEKCVENLWVPFHNMVRTSPWFQEYHEMLKYYGERYGEEILKFKDTFIRYSHRNIFIHASGPSKKTLRGATRLLYVLDELGWFDNDEGADKKERQSATEVYTALDRSLKTVKEAARRVILNEKYYDTVNAYGISISSPSDHRDKIMTLIRTHKNSTDVLTLHLPTWKFNPDMPRKAFAKEYRDNPITAERDYGAKPPLNDSPFISNGQAISDICGPTPNRVEYEYIHKRRKGGESMRAAKIISVHPRSGTQPKSVMALDAGHTNNSFAITIGHLESDRKHGVKPIVDVMMEIAPTYRENVLNYNQIYERILKPLAREFNVVLSVSDRWQNIKIMHDLEQEVDTLEYMEYQMTYDDMVLSRNYLLDERGLMRLPRMEMSPKEIDKLDMSSYPHCFYRKPVSHFWYQCITVKDKGNQVIKGLNLTDDIFRSTMLCTTWLLDEDWQSVLLESGRKRRTAIGVVQGRSEVNRTRLSQRQQYKIAKEGGVKGVGSIGSRSDNMSPAQGPIGDGSTMPMITPTLPK